MGYDKTTAAKPNTAAAGSTSSAGGLGEAAYQGLLRMLLNGELVSGLILQERTLAASLNMSRTPIRDALSRLESEGLVTRQMGRVAVSSISIEGYVEAINIRKLLEGEAAYLAAERIEKDVILRIRADIADLSASEQVTPMQRWALDDLVHGTIAEASGMALMATMIRDLRRRTHVFNTHLVRSRLSPGTQEHLALIDAIASGDPARSRTLMVEHLQNVKVGLVNHLLEKANWTSS